LGAARLYFPHGRKPGDPPVTDEKIFIVDRVDAMNPETERERLKEFATVVSEWLEEVSTVNTGLPARDRLSSHIFFWDMLEVRQLKRMFERHMQNPDVIELIEVLTRFFPPDSCCPIRMLSSLSLGPSSRKSCECWLGCQLPTITPCLMQRTVSSQMFGRMAPRINSICLLGSLPQ
jgi:hypothetical protein